MKCGSCKVSFSHVQFLLIHWRQTGCTWGRPVWERVLESRRQGHSGHRILNERWPHLWKSVPMPPEVVERMRALAAQRTLERKTLAKAKKRMRRIGR